MKNMKRGVSLVTVLLFMLVATIAATATYKWLTSEGRSSASRMMQVEAKQAAVAGIESARSWMTYHGNDVGAVVKQYFQNKKKPINLDNILPDIDKTNQNFSVSIVAVDASTNVYKIKVVSKGTSRNGTTHTEAAVMKVSGLYRVRVPAKEEHEVLDLDYNFGYVGGGTTMNNNSDANSGSASMLVYGDLEGAELVAKSDLIVTGNLGDANTNHLRVAGRTCVKGDLEVANQEGFEQISDLYVGGNAEFNMKSGAKITNAYFGGNATVGTKGADIEISGDVTLKGLWTNGEFRSTHIGGNMCLGPNAQIDFRTPNNQRKFTVDGSMWVPNNNALLNNKRSPKEDAFKYVTLGVRENSELYIQNLNVCNQKYRSSTHFHTTPTTYYWYNPNWYNPMGWKTYGAKGGTGYDFNDVEECPKDDNNAPTFFYQGHDLVEYDIYYSCPGYPPISCTQKKAKRSENYTAFTSSAKLENRHSSVSGEPSVTCDASIKNFCDTYFNQEMHKCGTNDALADLLQNAASSFGTKISTCVSNLIADVHADLDNGNGITLLNNCFSTTPASEKYNGYLVVKAKAAWMNKLFKNASKTIVGNYIFYVDEPENGAAKLNDVKLPPTSASSYVFIYLPNGAGNIDQNNGSIFNYFIYSEHDITKIASSGGPWNGSFYLSSANCAKVGTFGTGGATTINFDKDFLDDLTSSKIICPASAETCGDGSGGSETGSTSTEELVADGGYDTDYIATGAQLHIEVESEYANMENVSNPDPVNKSIVVLPRVVYLNEGAIGKLTDYFTVMPLNGARVERNGLTSCPGGPSATNDLSSETATMKTGKNYACTYTEGDYKSTFYISVVGGAPSDALVYFESPASVFIPSNANSTHTVNLIIPANGGTESQNISVEINIMSDNLTGWTISQVPGTSGLAEKAGSDGKVYVYTGTTGAMQQTVPLFTVSTTAGAQAGSAIFALQSPNNCKIVGNATKSFSITGSATIKREGIDKYCEKYPDNCKGENSKYLSAANDEECDAFSGIWVEAIPNCTTEEGMANEQWKCPSGNSSNNPIQLRALSFNSDYCVLYKPVEDNSIVGAKDDGENPDKPYILYASLKKKSVPLRIEKVGAKDSDTKIEVLKKKTGLEEFEVFNDECKSTVCEYSIPVGTTIKLVPNASGNDAFKYWSCHDTHCDWVNNVSEELVFTISENRSLMAHFNERDEHCFYSSLDTMTTACASVSEPETNRHCIDECDNSSKCNVGSGKYGDNAKWLRVASTAGAQVPSVDNGFLSHISGGQTSLIMHRNLAGPNGMLTARIKTAKVSAGHENEMLNDGFVVRSNKAVGEYLMVNIYGKSNAAYARVCLASGLSTSSANCVEHRLVNGSDNSFTIDPMEPINVKLTLNRSNLTVVAKGAYSHTFNLSSDWSYGTLNDAEHQFVGFKLSNPEFQIHDIGWRTDDFTNTACFDYPSISCSFAANYLGGQVPLETAVEPWVGYSSWFENSGSCSIDAYYYNGCDMPSSYFVNRWNGSLVGSCSQGTDDGYYKSVNNAADGLKLTSGNKFYFEEEGLHGYLHNDGNGYVQNGSVKAACPNTDNTSIDLFANCGRFYVGDQKKCSKNAKIFLGSEYISGERAFTQNGAVFNLREAALNFDFEGLSDGADIKIVLVDENGVESPARYLSNSATSIPVEEFLNKYGFNPEKVKTVRLQASSGFTLKAISSDCPYAITMNCNAVSARFDKENTKKWVITAPIGNVSNAKHCKITANSGDIVVPGEFVSCNENGQFMVDDNTEKPFEEHLHTGTGSLQYTFTIDAYEDDDADYNDAPTVSCDATTDEYQKMTIDCSIPENEKTVIQGLGVPTLTYSFENCPSTGCYYSVSLTSDITDIGYGGGKQPVTGGTWTPSVNTKAEKFSTGKYSYTVKATNKAGDVYESCTTDEFEVIAAVEATASCSISGNTLSISASSSNYENVPVKVVETSVLGHVLWTQNMLVNANAVSTSLDLNRDDVVAEGGTIVLSILYGTDGQSSCGTYERPVGVPTGECSVSPESMYSDATEKATFSVTDVTHCNSWVLKKDGVTDPVSSSSECGESILVPNLGPGTYSLYFNGSTDPHCSPTVAEKTHATLSCSSIAIEDKDAASSVEITIPHGNLTVGGCEGAGCTYTVAATTTGAAVSGATGDFTGGDITFNATNPSGTIGYSLTLTDDGGHITDACTFNVTYNGEEPEGCHCADYCGSGCENNLKLSGSHYENPATGCFFFNSTTYLNIQDKVNNVSNVTCTDGNPATCEAALAGVTAVDGGYYIKGEKYLQMTVTADYNPCTGTIVAPAITNCPSGNAPAGGTVSISPSASGCLSREGCEYTIKDPDGTTVGSGIWRKGFISFTDPASPSGNVNYTLTFSNSKGTSSKTCSVKYKNLKVISGYDNGNKVTLSNGECFVTTLSGSGNIRCGHNVYESSSCSIKVTYNNSSKTMTDAHCNNGNGNPLSATFSPTLEGCVELTGTTWTDCFITTW
ncbi:pilus assembly PilX N-terminal domain-containing protein [Fibrobacter sp.]